MADFGATQQARCARAYLDDQGDGERCRCSGCQLAAPDGEPLLFALTYPEIQALYEAVEGSLTLHNLQRLFEAAIEDGAW